MDFRHLRYFQAVAEERSYSRAAVRLRVAQPALSRAVKELEIRLEVRLLDRSRHHVQLTPPGSILLQEAGLILDRYEEAIRRVRRSAAGEEGEVRLGYIGLPTEPFLARLLRTFRERHPRVSIHLEERTPERVWERVALGRLNAGLTRPVESHPGRGLRTLLLRDEPLGAALPASHPRSASRFLPWPALAGESLIVLARREGMGLHDAVLKGCLDAGFAPRIARTPSLISTVLHYAEAGEGWAVVPDSVVPARGSLRFIPLRPAITVPLVLVWKEPGEPAEVRRFRELIEQWKAAGSLWPRLRPA
ncbi:MAG: LysR family transcriptional regulator [Verrucomicrobia bacterium]|nr:LysR family transcriptional regulator [Verrucomicrobiota bacterium]